MGGGGQPDLEEIELEQEAWNLEPKDQRPQEGLHEILTSFAATASAQARFRQCQPMDVSAVFSLPCIVGQQPNIDRLSSYPVLGAYVR